MNDDPVLSSAIAKCTTGREAEMLSYSGPIFDRDVNKFIAFALKRRRNEHKNISLLLTTYGGDADAAYRLARFLQSFYEHVRLYIVGPCKSAGTLVTLCADELAFGPFGEIGPLDMQISKKDDLMAMGSGLDTFQALSIIRSYAFKAFEEYMYDIVENSGGAISTQTAGAFAAQLVTGLFQPLMSQLDPQRMGEVQRLIDIAKRYGERLNKKNLKENTLQRLVEGYPSHTFVIDYSEAASLFKVVEQISPEEMAVAYALQHAGACVLHPSRAIVMFDVSTLLPEGRESPPEGQESENEAGKRSAQNPRKNDQRQSGSGRKVPRGENPRAGTPRDRRSDAPREPTDGKTNGGIAQG